MSLSMFLQLLVSGIASTFILFLASLGLVVILGYMKVVNLAHTEMLMMGAYICYFTYQEFRLPFLLCLIISFAVAFVFGAFIEVVIIRHFYGKASETLLVTYAISIILKQLALILFGKTYRQVPYPVKKVLHFGPVYIESYKLVLIAVSLFVLGITLLFFHKTKVGRKIRATTQNRNMTECLGIDTKKVDIITFSFGMGLAGLAGAAIAPLSTVSYALGEGWLTNTFMNVVMGGVGSLLGTLASSFIIQESISLVSGFAGSVTAQIFILLIVVVIVRLRPEGLFAVKNKR